MTCAPARALVSPEPAAEELPVAQRSAGGLQLLEDAAEAAQARTWTGTERVLSMLSGVPLVSSVTTTHGPGSHSATDALDARLFSLLAQHYELRVVGTRLCQGRVSRLVEAWRPGAGAVAARFWLDRATGLLLRRDVLDRTGALLRRNELLSVRTNTPVLTTATPPATTAAAPRGERLDEVALSDLELQGWPVIRTLPDHLDLYEARWLSDGVLHLSYSDGLSTLSLFVQNGERRPSAQAATRKVAGGDVWEAPGEPERAMWAADGRTWTLVSDAEPAVVEDVLAALPHTLRDPSGDGVPARVWRGMSRVGSWLNPFA
jgi:sigma-E factor negative regulatory protein RseB